MRSATLAGRASPAPSSELPRRRAGGGAEAARAVDQKRAADELVASEAARATLADQLATEQAARRAAAAEARKQPPRRVFAQQYLHQVSISTQKSYFGIPGSLTNMVRNVQVLFREHRVEERHSPETPEARLTDFEQCLAAKLYLHTEKARQDMAGEVRRAVDMLLPGCAHCEWADVITGAWLWRSVVLLPLLTG